MTQSLTQKLEARIAKLEKSGTHPRALEAMKEQLRGIKAARGRALKEIYFVGFNFPPTDND